MYAPTCREGRNASTADGTADHRRQNLHQRRIDESVLSRHRRQLTSLLREIEGTEVGPLERYTHTFVSPQPTTFFRSTGFVALLGTGKKRCHFN